MGQVVDKPATYADIEALPPHVVGELLFGKLVTHPRPAPQHAFAASTLGVDYLWYVDPVARTPEVFTRREREWVVGDTFFEDDPVSAPPFNAITFSLGELWPKDATTSPAFN